MANSNVRRSGEVALTIQNLINCEKGHIRGCQLSSSISVVPKLYRDQNPSCFDPQIISIGPLHREHKNVQEHEGLKATYLHDLLARLKCRLKSPPEQILNACLSKVLGSIKQIKECYEGGVMKYKDDSELANMMVKDACFILEFLVKRQESKLSSPPGNRFVMNHIICDLVLLENQIPFFVLQDIFDCAGVSAIECVKGHSLIDILLTVVLSTMNPFETKLPLHNLHSGNYDRYYYKHILDVLHKTYKPRTCDIPPRLSSLPVSHSAVELDLAGVNFKPNQDEDWQIMAIEYESSGFFCFHRPTLRMPVMNIHDKTELVLRNLIAYEQSAPINGYYFTSYVCAMDHYIVRFRDRRLTHSVTLALLVDNKEDVTKLVESRVIVNMLGSNESAANLINNIFYGLYYEEFSYELQWKKLDDYINFYWPRNTARLRQRYFNSPWNMIALVAVILLFVLAVIQTYYAVKSGR